MSSDICGQRRPRSDCASAQSDQDIHCPLTETLDTTAYMFCETRFLYGAAHLEINFDFFFFSIKVLKCFPKFVIQIAWFKKLRSHTLNPSYY